MSSKRPIIKSFNRFGLMKYISVLPITVLFNTLNRMFDFVHHQLLELF